MGNSRGNYNADNVFVSVGAVIFKLSGTLSELQTTLNSLNNILKEFKELNQNEHGEFRAKFEEVEKRIGELECIHKYGMTN